VQTPSRRHFLSGSVVTIAALGGCVSDENADDSPADEPTDDEESDDEESDDDISDGLAAALDAVPAESAIEGEYQSIVVASPDDADAFEDFGPQVAGAAESIDGIDAGDVDRVLLARTRDFETTVGVAAGSFDRPDPGAEVETGDEWRIGEGDDLAFASADDLVAFAGDGDGPSTDAVETAADAARGNVETLADADDHLPEAFGRLSDSSFVFYVPSVGGSVSTAINQQLQAMAAGFEAYPGRQTGTVENEYLLYPSDGATVGDEAVETFLLEMDPGQVVESDVERDDAVYVEVVSELPPERDRDAAPDATIRASVDAAEGLVEYEHRRGESVDAEELELWLDGEAADVQPADEFDAFEVGDVVDVETDPLASTALRWYDEDEDVQYVYARGVVGEDQFETEFDHDAETLEISYRGDRAADPEKLQVVHRGADGTTTPEQFADAYDSLTAGDAVTVEGVEIDDTVTLRLDVPSGPSGNRSTLLYFRASPPRLHLRRLEDQLIANYYGDRSHPADEFRVLVDGEPADTQLADVTETLDPNDDVELGEVPTGSEVVVNWTEPDEPIEVARHTVTPRARVATTYDADAGTVTVEHEDGEAIPAESLTLRVDGEAASVQPADEYDSFAPGDALTIDAEPFSFVEFVWNAGRDSEHALGRTLIARESIEGVYDADDGTIELVYVGRQEADPDRLVVRRGEGYPSGDDGSRPFAEEYDSLSDGDSVTLEDVGTDERVRVVLPKEAEQRWPIFQFSAEPQGSFSFERRDGEVVATYYQRVEREAEGFRILADGEETDVQPADEHDVLEHDDEIDLGEFPIGTELVVEWVQPDDPIEVRTHVVAPDAAFEADYDADAETVTVEHAGGDEIDADSLSVYAPPAIDEAVDWGDGGTVSEGDATTVEVSGDDASHVRVMYREQRVLDLVELKD